VLSAPEYADMNCSDGNFLGSVCEFECNVGYSRVGAAVSSCVNTSLGIHWSRPAPSCNPGNL